MAGDERERYINPYTDFGFKKLFGTEMNKDLLISFLNALLSGSAKEIEDVQYLNGENLGDGYGDRRSVFDVYCMAKDGSRFIVEMQKAEIARYSETERRQYEESKKVFWDNFSVIDTARQKGRAAGRVEEKQEMARRMKADGMATEIIAKYTGLTKSEIDALA